MLGRGFRVTFTKRCHCLCGDKVLRSQNGGNYLGEFEVPWGLDTNWFPAHWPCPDCQTSLQHGNTAAYKRVVLLTPTVQIWSQHNSLDQCKSTVEDDVMLLQSILIQCTLLVPLLL